MRFYLLKYSFQISFLALQFLPVTSNCQTEFPQEWIGNWKGDLEIFNAKGKAQTIDMELHIQPLDSLIYTWTIIYKADTIRDERKYFLKTKDAAKGRYEIDEGNSIVLDAYLLGGVLYEQFEVMGSTILTRTEKQGENLVFEILAGKTEPANTTGGITHEGEEIPAVKSFPLTNYQKAILKKF